MCDMRGRFAIQHCVLLTRRFDACLNNKPKCNSKKPVDIQAGNGLLSITKREVALMQAYCVKCRSKKEMKDAKAITMKNGKPATQGTCPVCGTKMFRIGKS